MQRKLSKIAEIPKILSSTLATVTQTFDMLLPTAETGKQHGRKLSYDEDAIDYELVEQQYADGAVDNYDDCIVNGSDSVEAFRQELVELMRKTKLKDRNTPESDYASEFNFVNNQANSGDNNSADEYDYEDDDADNDGKNDNEEAADNVSLNSDDYDYVVNYTIAANSKHNNGNYASNNADDDGVDNEYDDDDDDDDDYDYDDDDDDADTDDDGSDFLTTTYTWNLRNVPKLKLNDEMKNFDCSDDDVDCQTTEAQQSLNDKQHDKQANAKKPQLFEQKKDEKLSFKLDNTERAWPWADREKIIYKQSTCHLVPRKPLGLVEKRIQLLAKQNLLNNLQKLDQTK